MDRGIRKAIERRALTAAGGAIARRDVSQVLRRCALFRLKSLAVLLTTVHCFYPSFARSADADSLFLSLSRPTLISRPNQELLAATIQGGRSVLVLSDGSFMPKEPVLADAFIMIDGHKVSNDSWIDVRGEKTPLAHTFRAIGMEQLTKGSHRIALVASGTSPFSVNTGSDLVIMTSPAERFATDAIDRDSDIVDVDPPPRGKGSPLPFKRIATVQLETNGGPLVAFSAGRSYHALSGQAGLGDAMWSLWIDGSEAEANSASITDNDLTVGGEAQAPMFNQGFFDRLSKGTHQLTLGAEAEPWPAETGPDKVRFRVGAGTRLVALTGGIAVAGHVLQVDLEKEDGRFAFRCVASSNSWKTCPVPDQDVVVATASIVIPSKHNGVVLFSGMTRIQGDSKDPGGTIDVWLTVDGARLGSAAEQQLAFPGSESTRTVSLSFLATGDNALSVGKHEIELHARALGSFMHLMVTRDTPLIWFD
jgi:hypothetical protein